MWLEKVCSLSIAIVIASVKDNSSHTQSLQLRVMRPLQLKKLE